ncbi:MAG TPA: hypothetical protein VN612_04450 [Acidobacteriaceae bacterium]|nr:hypothetical protein [Acidobacteriaceae bacterium]
MVCKVCVQLQEAVASSQMPDAPDLLLGLTEAGLRNRAHQKAERKVKSELDLEKHRRSCREWNERAAF